LSDNSLSREKNLDGAESFQARVTPAFVYHTQ